jgi:hypothetical protein
VPICSRERAFSREPPSPTHTAEYVSPPALQVALGCVQEPDTLLKREPTLTDGTAT